MAKEKIKKGFNTVHFLGKAKISDKTFTIDKKGKENTDWNYSTMYLRLECGDGVGYVSLNGGFSQSKENVLYVHGKKHNSNGKEVDDYSSQFKLQWHNRFDEEQLNHIGENCFVKVGIEKDTDGNVVVKRFLSPYDAIGYLKETLKDSTEVVVSADLLLKPDEKGEKTFQEMRLTSIYLAKQDVKVSDYGIKFQYTVLLTNSSFDKAIKPDETGMIPVYGNVVDYLNKHYNKEVKANVCYPVKFYMEARDGNTHIEMINKLLKPSRDNVTEVIMTGKYITQGNTVQPSLNDLPDDTKELITLGYYTEKEAMDAAVSGDKTTSIAKFVRPLLKKDGKGNSTPSIFKDKYKEEDLLRVGKALGDISTTKGGETVVETLETDEELVTALFGGDDQTDDFFADLAE